MRKFKLQIGVQPVKDEPLCVCVCVWRGGGGGASENDFQAGTSYTDVV